VSTSQTNRKANDKGGTNPNEVIAALQQQLNALQSTVTGQFEAMDGTLRRGTAFGQYQFVDVTFSSTSHGDTVIRHDLILSDPEAVRVIPVEWGFASTPVDPPYVYRNTASTRRAWGRNHIILKCNLASAQARLLLVVEAR
jgi:hypothetical protein